MERAGYGHPRSGGRSRTTSWRGSERYSPPIDTRGYSGPGRPGHDLGARSKTSLAMTRYRTFVGLVVVLALPPTAVAQDDSLVVERNDSLSVRFVNADLRLARPGLARLGLARPAPARPHPARARTPPLPAGTPLPAEGEIASPLLFGSILPDFIGGRLRGGKRMIGLSGRPIRGLPSRSTAAPEGPQTGEITRDACLLVRRQHGADRIENLPALNAKILSILTQIQNGLTDGRRIGRYRREGLLESGSVVSCLPARSASRSARSAAVPQP